MARGGEAAMWPPGSEAWVDAAGQPAGPQRHHVSSLTRERQQAVKQERTRSEGQACVGLTDPLPPPPCTEQREQAMCMQGRGDQDGAASALYRRRTEVALPPRWRGWENPETVWTGIRAEDTQSMLPGPYGVWDCRSHVPVARGGVDRLRRPGSGEGPTRIPDVTLHPLRQEVPEHDTSGLSCHSWSRDISGQGQWSCFPPGQGLPPRDLGERSWFSSLSAWEWLRDPAVLSSNDDDGDDDDAG
ncbi:hypothetical protein J1605_000775 [Eschrichtius robustus]|uniref:Uncharacterized protein n=1 Tax=Eschrichtius robustus TaxID=9764 RepID=A0AB34GNI0_ESCRO|nr:hypothetical protein J1605_000775 [Eschrichtius robustus]